MSVEEGRTGRRPSTRADDGRSGRRPTMREVAAIAGVSLSTVSRVINGVDVQPELARRVQDAVELLGYRRDLTASNLRRADRLSATIGLLLEDVANPFFSALQRSVEDVAGRRGVLAFAGSSDEDPARERRLVEEFLARGVDGLIIAPTGGDHSYLARDHRAGVAIVFVDRPPRFIDADAVVSDNAGGAEDAVAHLIEAGHRRIAFLGDRDDLWSVQERYEGFTEALATEGLAPDPALIRHGLQTRAAAAEAAAALTRLPEPPTALFASNDLMTMGAVDGLHGWAGSIALVGFDEFALADKLTPQVTVVAQDPAAIGATAAQLLFGRIGGDSSPPRDVVLLTRLVARGSGEIAPLPV